MTGLERPSAPGRMSVVVAAWTDAASLECCISSLLPQLFEGEDELIIARNFAITPTEDLLRRSVLVRDLGCLTGRTVPELRAAGSSAARMEVVAFIEDHCACGPSWREALMAAHAGGAEAVGGPVALGAGSTALDAAVYFYDYAAYMPPVSGRAVALSGANMSFSRRLLARLLPIAHEPVREAVLVPSMIREGLPMYLSGDAVVVHAKKQRAVHVTWLTFSLARDYAASRFQPKLDVRRLGYAAGAVVLPFLLGYRIAKSSLRAPRMLPRLAASSLWLAVLLGCWSVGEVVGYVAGAGNSAKEWQ